MMLNANFLIFLSFSLRLTLASAFDPSREEVTFTSRDGFQLEGTLRLPASTIPVPGVVLIHGSGPNNRDETALAFGHLIHIFAEIGDALQDQGIAVLTYDKRTCSSFNGFCNNSYPYLTEMNVTANDFVEDAMAAVRYLHTRSEIDETVIAVGQSQAASYIPVMLEMEPNVIHSGVMIAGTFRPFDEQTTWKINFMSDMLNLLGYNASTCDPQWDLYPILEEWNQAIRNGSDVSDIPELGLSVAYWKALLDLNDKALSAAAKINQQSLLVLHGDMDWVVPPSDAESWSNYLKEVGADYETKILPCVTHLLNCIKRFPYDIGETVDVQVTDSLIDFVLANSPDTDVKSAISSASHDLLRSTMQVLFVTTGLVVSFF